MIELGIIMFIWVLLSDEKKKDYTHLLILLI